MSGAGGSQNAVSAVRRSKRTNKGMEYRDPLVTIEESDEDEDLGGYSSGTEGPSDVVHAHDINRRNDDNNDLDGPSPESVNEVADVDENTESSVISDRNVDRTLVWEEFSDSDLANQPRKEYDGGPLRPANEATGLTTKSKAIEYVDLFYPPARMRQHLEYSKKYRDLPANESKYISYELNYADILGMHEVWGLSGLNPVPSMRSLHHQSYAFRGHPAQAVMSRDRFAFARAMFKVGDPSAEEEGDCLSKIREEMEDFAARCRKMTLGGKECAVDEITVHIDGA